MEETDSEVVERVGYPDVTHIPLAQLLQDTALRGAVEQMVQLVHASRHEVSQAWNNYL